MKAVAVDPIQRLTISLSSTLGARLDHLVGERHYQSRSEAVRDLIGEGLERWKSEALHDGDAACIANLSYVVDCRISGLAQRMAELQHAHHDLVATGTILRLDHFHSMETIILKGKLHAVRAFSDRVRAEKGVRFGAMNLLLVTLDDSHDHIGDHSHHGHHHLSPPL